MSYELRCGEAIGEGLRRICRKQIDLALQIATDQKESDDTPVHETRKHIKKARAALRLVKKEIGRGLFKAQDHDLRDVGRLISDIRDAEVRLQTVRQLQGLTSGRKHRRYGSIEEMLGLELENFIGAFAEWQSQAVPMLEKARDTTDTWPVANFGNQQLCRAVSKMYRRGRRSLAHAKGTGKAEDFHEFRSRAKQLWYHLRILRPMNPVVIPNLADELGALCDLLGRAHDLSFLGDRLRGERWPSKLERENHQLLAVIEASGADLQGAATDLAERFFTERPRDFAGRVADWLDHGIDKKSDSVAGELVGA